jgi:hypothetical protein
MATAEYAQAASHGMEATVVDVHENIVAYVGCDGNWEGRIYVDRADTIPPVGTIITVWHHIGWTES